MNRKIDKVIIHHSATGVDNTQGIVKIILKKWGVHPYHYYIWINGEIITWQNEDKRWGHTVNTDYNLSSIWICLIGNFENHNPSKSQYDSLIKLIKNLEKKYGELKIFWHGEVPNNKTLCPGKNLDLEFIKNEVKKKEIEKWFYENIFYEEFPDGIEILKNLELAKEKCFNKDWTLNANEFFYLIMILMGRK